VGIYGTMIRVGIPLVMVPAVLFGYVILTGVFVGPAAIVLWLGLISGLASGLAGSAIESYGGFRRDRITRLVAWTLVTAVVLYVFRWIIPVVPLTFLASLIAGLLVGVIQAVITPQFTAH
jgi:dolichyl-phosphate-mannose--protein O-mannosyl transferase